MVAARDVGRTRLFTLNPSYLAKQELAAYLARLADAGSQANRPAAPDLGEFLVE